MQPAPAQPLGFFRNIVATLGASFIYALIRIFGRVVLRSKAVWLWGPIGGDHIGDKPYEQVAAQENLTVIRRASAGGLISDFGLLRSLQCTIEHVRPEIRDFYEHTAAYRMDVWSKTYFPGNVGLWLMVTTLSRKFDQLNFPLSALDTAKGIDSEVIHLTHPDGSVRYAGWYRRLRDTGRTIYTGFYMTEVLPMCGEPCVKVVFPMPNGNATVLLRPSVRTDGSLRLSSNGRYFGDAGFYRIDRVDAERLRVWRVRTLREDFHVYVDSDNVLRCDHSVRFLGMRVLHLHYRIERRSDLPPPPPTMTNRVDAESKRIHATARRVFEAFADASSLQRWLPPVGMTATISRFDFREGGGYQMRLTNDDVDIRGKTEGNADDVVVRFLKIVPEQRIEQSVTFVSEQPEFSGEMLMTWELESRGAHTQVSVTCENVPAGISAIDHKTGLASTLINLARHLSEREMRLDGRQVQ